MGWQSENTPVQIYAQNELKLTLFGGVEKQVNIYLQLSLLQASKVNFSLSCCTGSCHFQCLILIAINMSSSKPHNKPPYCFEMVVDVISKSDISLLRRGVALQAQAKPYPWMIPPKLPLPLMLTLTLNPTKPKPKMHDRKNVPDLVQKNQVRYNRPLPWSQRFSFTVKRWDKREKEAARENLW